MDPVEWLQAHASETLCVFRDVHPRLGAFPSPEDRTYCVLLVLAEAPRGMSVRVLRSRVPEVSPSNLWAQLHRWNELGLVVRVKHGSYRLGPRGSWWLEFWTAIHT
jgi:hypothetical protein